MIHGFLCINLTRHKQASQQSLSFVIGYSEDHERPRTDHCHQHQQTDILFLLLVVTVILTLESKSAKHHYATVYRHQHVSRELFFSHMAVHIICFYVWRPLSRQRLLNHVDRKQAQQNANLMLTTSQQNAASKGATNPL